jgi:cytochrome c2
MNDPAPHALPPIVRAKKILLGMAKVLGAVAVVATLIVVGIVIYVSAAWPIKAKPGKISIQVASTPERVSRGKQLVSIRCALCHYDQKTGALTGTRVPAEPAAFGVNYSHNITKHPTKGLGRYSDGELIYLLRTGIRRDGIYTGPYMVSFLADEDLYSIVAFLRSDDPWVAAKDVDDQPSKTGLLMKFLMHFVIDRPAYPQEEIPRPSTSDEVAWGRYLVLAVGDCFVCHSRSFPTLNVRHPEKSADFMGGGNELRDATDTIIRGANLTMDRETGIGSWSKADFVRALRSGVGPDGRVLRYPMLAYGELSEAEASAIFAYLKTVPPLHKPINRGLDQLAQKIASAAGGEKAFLRYGCQSCHGVAGVGICDLRQARRKYDTDAKLEAFIRDPSKFVPGSKMPTWNGVIPEADYAPLIAHINTLQLTPPQR